MAVTVASLQAVLDLDKRGFDNKIQTADRNLNTFANSVKGGLGSAAKFGALGIAGIATAAVGLGSVLVGLGSDAEEMRGKFDVVFGANADQWANRFDQLGDKLNRNKFELMGFGAALQDTFVPLGFARDEAGNFAISLTELAVDMASFNNAAESDVLNDLQSALVGNHETVRKYGVILTEAVLKQELAKMGMDDLTGAALEQAKVQARMNLIMAGTTDAQGDAIRTAGSWANQMRAVKSAVTEAATEMGVALLPVLTPILQNFGQLSSDVLPSLVDRFTQFANELQTTVGPAMLLIDDALNRIAIALGSAEDPLTAGEIAFAAFGATLDAIVIGVQAAAVGMQGIAWGVEQASEAVRIAIDLYNQFLDVVDAVKPANPLDAAGAVLDAAGNELATQAGNISDWWNGDQQQAGPVNNNIQVNPTPVTISLDGEKIAETVSRYQGPWATNYTALGGIGAQ